VRELRFSFSYFSATFDRDQPEILYITGGGANLRNLDAYLARELKLRVSCLPFPPNIHLKPEKPNGEAFHDKKEKRQYRALWQKPQGKKGKGQPWPFWGKGQRLSQKADQETRVASDVGHLPDADAVIDSSSAPPAKESEKVRLPPLNFSKEEPSHKQVGYLKKIGPGPMSSLRGHRRRKGNKIINADGALPVLDQEVKAKKALMDIVGSQESLQGPVLSEVPPASRTTSDAALESSNGFNPQMNGDDSSELPMATAEPSSNFRREDATPDISQRPGWEASRELSSEIPLSSSPVEASNDPLPSLEDAPLGNSNLKMEDVQGAPRAESSKDSDGDDPSAGQIEGVRGKEENKEPAPEVTPAASPISEVFEKAARGEMSREVANMLINAIGAGMSDIHGVNLLPPEIRAQKHEQVQKISLRLIGFAILMIQVALIFLMRFQEQDYQNRIKNAKIQLELVKTIEMWNEKIIKKEGLVRSIDGGRISVKDVLLMVSMQVPPDVILDQLTLDPSKGNLSIQGVITAKEDDVEAVLTDFMEDLESSSLVGDVSLISTKRMGGGVQRFDISCQLSKE
jgi:hypothetical protein